jgi:hypothetical protein
MRVDTFKYEGSKYGRLTAKWPAGRFITAGSVRIT